jgi:LmbE family N-acetylglucosaminyl deacetylase
MGVPGLDCKRSWRRAVGVVTLAALLVAPRAAPGASERKESPVRSVLIVLAHPDDETMLGATLGRLREQRVEVHVLYATHGEGGKELVKQGGAWVSTVPRSRERLKQRRDRELHRALKWYGVADYVVLDHPDNPLREKDGRPTRDPTRFISGDKSAWDAASLRGAIAGYAKKVQPDLVVTMLPHNGAVHAHHQAVGQVTQELFEAGALGAKVKQLYAVEERAWYPAGEFVARGGAATKKIVFSAGSLPTKWGLSYARFAERGAHKHESQAPGHRGVIETPEVFVPLGGGVTHVDAGDPLATLLHFSKASGTSQERRSVGGKLRSLVRRVGLGLRMLGPGPRRLTF